MVTANSFLEFIEGASRSPCEKVDLEITDHMRGKSTTTFIGGSDIAAVNIARGRDHGLPPYFKMRSLYNLHGGQLSKREDLERLYQNSTFAQQRGLRNMDLWVGGLAEHPKGGGKVGPLFEHIIGEQFNKIRFGDRYFFTGKDKGTGKTVLHNDLRRMIRQRRLMDIYCDNLLPELSTGQMAGQQFQAEMTRYLASLNMYVQSNMFQYTSPKEQCKNRKQLKLRKVVKILEQQGHLGGGKQK